MTDDLEHLIRQTKAGDMAAFTTLVCRYQNMAYAAACAQLQDTELAKDVVQEAFLACWRGMSALGQAAAFGGFLRGIVRNLCRRQLRRRRMERHARRVMGDLSPAAPPECDDERQIRMQAMFAAIRTLTEFERETVILYHLLECSQRQTAAILQTSVAKVNNTLHSTREKLQRKALAMVKETLSQHALPQDFARQVGKIVSVNGALLEAQFDSGEPGFLDTFALLDPAGVVRGKVTIIQRLPGGRLRCMATGADAAVATGQVLHPVHDEIRVSVADDMLRRLVEQVAPSQNQGTWLETGIKPVDLFCPLPRQGRIAIVGPMGAGRIVLISELCKRLHAPEIKLTIFTFLGMEEGWMLDTFAERSEPFITQQHAGRTDTVETFYIPSARGSDPAALQGVTFDAVIYLDMLLGLKGLYPAIDSRLSTSRLLTPAGVGAAHATVARDVRAAIAKADVILLDPDFIKYAANDAYAAARQRWTEFERNRLPQLNAADRLTVTRARKLQFFLTNPFYVVEPETGKPGVTVPVGETLEVCKDILGGNYDETDEKAFHYKGGRSSFNS